MPERVVRLRPGRERSVRNRHPWLYSGAIAAADCEDGEVAEVYASDGGWLARGYYNGRSQIRLRLLTWERDEAIDEGFWRRRLRRAIEGRRRLPAWGSTAIRLANAESDGLPGLVADLYTGTAAGTGEPVAALVLQALALGIDRRKAELAELLRRELAAAPLLELDGRRSLHVYERSDVDVRRLEGLPSATGPMLDTAPPTPLVIHEGGVSLEVDVARGHKTGFYLDQAVNRRRVAAYCGGARVLNCFSYTAGFSMHALAQGAVAVTDVDSSREALQTGRRNLEANGFAPERRREVGDDVFQALRRYRDQGERFDVVILDPPKFAYRTDQVQAACRGYKDINLLATSILEPGGVLATFSCSGLVSADLFQKVVFGAVVDAGRDVQVLEVLSQAPDHPVALTFPESHYLKGFVCRVW